MSDHCDHTIGTADEGYERLWMVSTSDIQPDGQLCKDYRGFSNFVAFNFCPECGSSVAELAAKAAPLFK